MKLRRALLLVAAVSLGAAAWMDPSSPAGEGEAPKQGSKPPKESKPPKPPKPPPDEVEKILDALKDAAKPVKTERDKFLEEVRKVVPGGSARSASGGAEFDAWFRGLADGGDVWRREDISKKSIREIFDRIATRLGVTSGSLTREEFLDYAARNLSEGRSPPWKVKEVGPRAEADKLFRKIDRSGDGLIDYDEATDGLRRERDRWDANGDGFVDIEEYRAYILGRTQSILAEIGTPPTDRPRREAPAPAEDAESRRASPRPGSLPPELPGWYGELDTDRDGQLGLYEWRRSRWALTAFLRLDRNDDGFLTPPELLYHVRQAEEGGPALTDLLDARPDRQRRPDRKAKGEPGG